MILILRIFVIIIWSKYFVSKQAGQFSHRWSGSIYNKAHDKQTFPFLAELLSREGGA